MAVWCALCRESGVRCAHVHTSRQVPEHGDRDHTRILLYGPAKYLIFKEHNSVTSSRHAQTGRMALVTGKGLAHVLRCKQWAHVEACDPPVTAWC